MTRRLNAPALTSLALAALALGACTDRAVTGSTYPREITQRHPIVLTDAPRTLDVFASAEAGLDGRQREDVRAFAAEYRRYGRGPLVAQVPKSGHRGDLSLGVALQDIRASLIEGGVPAGHLNLGAYVPSDPAVASPVRLSFQRLQAKVAGKCGLWPQDLGISDLRSSTNNEPYWNLGCATQANIAAQVADPVDLVRGRQETRIDTVRRARDIETLRQGKDPSTTFKQDDRGKINTSVGN